MVSCVALFAACAVVVLFVALALDALIVRLLEESSEPAVWRRMGRFSFGLQGLMESTEPCGTYLGIDRSTGSVWWRSQVCRETAAVFENNRLPKDD